MGNYPESLTRVRDAKRSDAGAFRLFVAAQLVWLAVSIPLVMSFGITSNESLFVLVFVGFLVAGVLFEPVESEPRWWIVSRWLARGGFVVLGYLILQRAQELGIWAA
jgi:hypothetical protein